MNESYKTAKSRQALSVPMRYLRLCLNGRLLDYGCGKGSDADALGMEKYDPHWFPEEPKGKFQTITCNYVLNVIESPEERRSVEDRIIQLLAPGGLAFISVRDDVVEGSETQWTVQPSDRWNLIKHTKGRFRVYQYHKPARRKHKCKTCKP